MNDTFQALGDPTRREILRLLRERDMTAGELSDKFQLAKSTLSGHFSVLKNAGLIIADKRGTTIVYSLNLSVVEETVATFMNIFSSMGNRKGAKQWSRTGALKPRYS
jgi:ArsR family transcriptional regulator, arsenate/arsenite/antimonite-responsive transcriptional repressor